MDDKLPGTYKAFVARFPDLAEAHEAIAKGVEGLGPLDAKSQFLVKVGICVGSRIGAALARPPGDAMRRNRGGG